MGTPYTPPGKDPTGYPGPTPDSPQPAFDAPVEPTPEEEEETE